MRIYKIKVLPNKEMKCINGNIVCKKGENKIDVLSFSVDDDLLQFNNFLILRSPSGTTYIDILTNDLEYIIGSFITNDLGDWSIQFISSTQEDIVVESEIEEDKIIMISDILKLKVVDSLASGELVLPPTSANLDLLGQELANLYNTFYTLIQDYPEIEEYIEVQEQLEIMAQEMKKTQDMIANIKVEVDTSDLKVEVDMSEINTKLDDLDDKVTNIPTNDYSSDLGQIQSDVTTTKGMITSMNNAIQNGVISNLNIVKQTTENTKKDTEDILERMGDNDTKQDGTLFNYSYWGLVRAEEAKSAAMSNNTMLQTIYTQISDANTLSDEILALLEG